jgi:magnesium transporter
MKHLTVWATILLPITFITSVYGMNFHTDSPYNMPELTWKYGYLVCWVLIIATVLGMLFYFRKKRWIS